MRTPIIPLALLLLGGAAAQEPPAGGITRGALDWAVGLGSRFEGLTNAVVSSYALGQLAARVCEQDKTAGAGLFRSALSRLNTLSDDVFVREGPILPVSSFTGLWKSIMPAAEQCDPGLGQLLDKQRTAARIADERLRANEKLAMAVQVILKPENHCFQPQQPPSAFARPTGANLYRCIDYPAQLADNAISTGDPDMLEIATLTLILVNVRDRVPELTDDLFVKSLGVALSPPAPRMALLGALGSFLFTAPASGAIRRHTNPYSISAYIDAVLKAADATDSPYYNGVSAYRIMYPLLATAREMELDSASRLEQALAKIQVSPSEVEQAQASLNGRTPPISESILRRDRLIDRVLSEARQKRFDAARNLLPDLDDSIVRDQLRTLITYTETLDAIEVKDFDRAFQLANGLRSGVKRALLYAGIMAKAPPEVALSVTSLAARDAAALTAEHRVAVLSAASAALVHADSGRALTLVNEVVKAMNSATVQPYLAIFDPRRERVGANSGNATSTDATQILLRDSRLDEVVDSGMRWHMFELHVSGPAAFSLPGVVRNAAAVDPASLEAAVLGVRDETHLANALNALAELRLTAH